MTQLIPPSDTEHPLWPMDYNLLRPFITPNSLSVNHRVLFAKKKLALTLYFLKDIGSITMTANTFGVHQKALSKVIVEICNAVVINLVQDISNYDRWP